MEKQLPVERTPGTRARWGISVGIDWASHALHRGEDSETGGREKVANTKITTIMPVLPLVTPIFFV